MSHNRVVGSAGRAIEWAGLSCWHKHLDGGKRRLESSRLPGAVARCGVTVA